MLAPQAPVNSTVSTAHLWQRSGAYSFRIVPAPPHISFAGTRIAATAVQLEVKDVNDKLAYVCRHGSIGDAILDAQQAIKALMADRVSDIRHANRAS